MSSTVRRGDGGEIRKNRSYEELDVKDVQF